MYRKHIFCSIIVIIAAMQGHAQRTYAANSVLATGNWYKIGVLQEGVYKVDAAFLNSLGINIHNLASASIRLYGNGGQMLDENNAVPRVDDLFENAIQVVDGGDSLFNNNDYFLFYARGPNRWLNDSSNRQFVHQKNLYSDTAFYFITIGGSGKRIQATSNAASPNIFVNSYDERYFHENDLVNFLNSGKEWYGEEFSSSGSNSLNRSFTVDLPGLITTRPVIVRSNVAGRTVGAAGSFNISINGQAVQHITVGAVSGYFLDAYATSSTQQNSFIASQSTLSISINYTAASGAQGWLNWFEIQGRRTLDMNGANQLFFRDRYSVGTGNTASFTIAHTTAATDIWEITDPLQPEKMNSRFTSTQTIFINDASRLREYVAFADTGFLTPLALGTIDNQNLHHSSFADYIIITNPAFLSQASRLASFHTQQYGNTVTVVTTNKIYNEFSGGAPDPAALRDFVKMYYDKAGTDSTKRPRYLLLFGAASYDYKNRIKNNTSFVPCYESVNALDPLNTYVSDDFFGLLGDADDVNLVSPASLLDIGIGRLPARTVQEAKTMVDKIIQYHSAQSFGAWRNQSVFTADDKDNNVHLNDAESVAADAASVNPFLNQTKIYLDAYPLVSGSGGGRYPDVNNAIVNQVYNGALFFNYNGHGGYQRLADEAVLGPDEAKKFDNPNKLSLFITATCDFAPYDDPAKNSIGGSLLYDGPTGAIALMTTTRVVFAYSNRIINDNYLKIALQPGINGKYLTLGEAVQRAKNYTYQTYSDVFNNRKFTLLGDPAMRLAFPQLKLNITTINHKPITGNDTLKALLKYTFTGTVTDAAGNLQNNFTGTVYPTVFDKPQLISTLGNDPASPVTKFSQQTSILYKGKASVNNGLYSFSFIVPKDINYKVGNGKLSLYADNGLQDANGYSASFLVGSTGDTLWGDKTGPGIKAYLGDTLFVNGSNTNDHPFLIVWLYDSSGINTSGTGIGHDITAVIDGDEKNMIVLNNYYAALLDSYQRGQVYFQLPTLKEGKHTITIKAWDVANNSNEVTIEFTVVKNPQPQISAVTNYPNPFSTKTIFRFQHNLLGSGLAIVINIYTTTGILVGQLKKSVSNTGSGIVEIEWDGRGISNEKLMKAVYIYHIIASSNTGKAEATNKLMMF